MALKTTTDLVIVRALGIIKKETNRHVDKITDSARLYKKKI